MLKANRMSRVDKYWDVFQGAMIACFTAVMAYFDSTSSFMIALMLAFTFNILAGMRADNVKLKIERIYPPKFFQNFNGNKFKDSLFELLLIIIIIYLLKGMADLMDVTDTDTYVVKYLTWIALYYYTRNALRNLSRVYPKNKFLRIVYVVISFKFKEFFSDDLRKEIEKIENEDE